MINYLVRRVLYMVPTVILISIVAFVIIQLPPGSYLETLLATMRSQGQSLDPGQVATLEARYGLDQPIFVQYLKWISAILLHGDFGQSFEWDRSVSELLGERLPLTVTLAISTLLFTWIVAFPIGIYSAVRQYSAGDYLVTTLGFLGLAIPNFLIALVLMYVGYHVFGQSVGGLFSPQFQDSAWNLGKLLDLLSHLWVPVVVLGMGGTAALIKAMATADLDKQIATMKQLMRLAKDQFWQLGIVVPTGAYGIARNAMHNIPKRMYTGGDFDDPGPTNPHTYYYA